MISFAGKRVLVMGIARSGMAAISALHKRGAKVYAYDRKNPEQLEPIIKILSGMGIDVFAGTDPDLETLCPDLIVISPGISLETGLVMEAARLAIPVVGELELAFRLKSPEVEMYAVTGTNGKTTTTALVNHILLTAGRNSSAGGNIGVALCELVDAMAAGVLVVEVSSFQLETTREFHPRISGIINITPDHLDRHKTMEEYTRIKARIFARQTQEDHLVLNYEDARVRAFADQASAKVAFFSCERNLHPGIFIDNGQIVIDWQGEQQIVASLSELRLRGKHNLENTLCAVGMAWMAGVSSYDIQRSLNSFGGVRHRLEEVARHEGVVYINDSKGTNPDSTIKALESFEQPIVLIAGGRAKGGSYAEVGHKIVERVKELVLVGEASSMIREAVQAGGMESDHIHDAPDFRSAVYQASHLAQPGDVVLLSPACASWDMFPSYEHRGDLFCQIVAEIIADIPQRI